MRQGFLSFLTQHLRLRNTRCSGKNLHYQDPEPPTFWNRIRDEGGGNEAPVLILNLEVIRCGKGKKLNEHGRNMHMPCCVLLTGFRVFRYARITKKMRAPNPKTETGGEW